jgi:hypothetical protein
MKMRVRTYSHTLRVILSHKCISRFSIPPCVSPCIYRHTYILSHMQATHSHYSRLLIFVYTQTHIHTYTHTHRHARACTYACVRDNIRMHTYVRTYIHTYAYTYMHAWIHGLYSHDAHLVVEDMCDCMYACMHRCKHIIHA